MSQDRPQCLIGAKMEERFPLLTGNDKELWPKKDPVTVTEIAKFLSHTEQERLYP